MLRLEGHGWGHRRGLSQWSAQGAALSGVDATWRPAALQAQAVAARSLRHALADHAPPTQPYDLCDGDACQLYGGAVAWTAGGTTTAVEAAATDAAILATVGQIRTSQGAAILAEFGASNGGYSTAGSQPYLAAAPDPWDGVDPANTGHTWSATAWVSPASSAPTAWAARLSVRTGTNSDRARGRP